MKGLIIY
jgi:hypothetical protein